MLAFDTDASLKWCSTSPLWHIDAVGRGVHPIINAQIGGSLSGANQKTFVHCEKGTRECGQVAGCNSVREPVASRNRPEAAPPSIRSGRKAATRGGTSPLPGVFIGQVDTILFMRAAEERRPEWTHPYCAADRRYWPCHG